ncbi:MULTISPECIES: cytochrome c oxidase subunit 3 [unclassified Cupriavidus]|uniref:cytochrome c oxidase subunit 3 n=1 Tax=unclassified Cupriavidus TaxID=2640874 RepID=UPI0010FA1CBF|nr:MULTISPECIES: cytochrome c oxidase subunit 3 [unclassified Cupriavidus]MWL90298.1 bb3-type cytochrome oxidase subunit III [Cupriavidus sp. SW-Y-13]
MNPDATATQSNPGVFRVSRESPGSGPGGDATQGRGHPAPGSIGLWVFMAVVTSLFALFLAAYVMRMDSPDWHRIALPWQVWLSTALLMGASVAMAVASRAARAGRMADARRALRLGALGAAAFVGSQLWAWSALHAIQVGFASHPAGSFFYLLTAMHGLHMLGGLIGYTVVASDRGSGVRTQTRIALCARYWHFLLAVWLVLLATLGWLTPELVDFICGRG